jgi:uncharacterized protein
MEPPSDVIPEAVEAPPPPAPARPAPVTERLAALDLIRGIAILGILPVNLPYFAGLDFWTQGPTFDPSPAGRAVSVVTLFFFSQKFITLLSMLFGVGLAIQMRNARAAGRPFDRYYLRRMGVLFLIGLAHGLLLWDGDILATYAVVALGALLLGRLPRFGVLLSVGLLLAWSLGFAVVAGTLQALFVPGGGGGGPAFLSPENQVRIFRDGSLGEMVLLRAAHLGIIAGVLLVYMGWYVLACFLVGVHLFRSGFFTDPERQRARLPYLFAFLALGVLLHLAAVVFFLREQAVGAAVFNTLGALPMALGYLGLLVLWARSGRGEWLQARLREVGRTALSNYLLQSVLCALLFYHPGLRLFGQLPRVALVGVVAGVWLAGFAFSHLWLRAFRMGPVEWLWRSLAEGRRRPILRGTSAGEAVSV